MLMVEVNRQKQVGGRTKNSKNQIHDKHKSQLMEIDELVRWSRLSRNPYVFRAKISFRAQFKFVTDFLVVK